MYMHKDRFSCSNHNIPFVRYTIQYEDKDGVETIIVTKDDRNKVKILSNLMPASNYTLNTTTVLPAEYGGMGDTTSSKVYTG